MRIEFDGTTYDYDPANVTIDALIVIKDFTGYNYEDWIKALESADPRSLRAFWWHMRRQAGVVETIAAAPDVNALALLAAVNAAAEAEAAAAPQAEAGGVSTDPTEAPVAVPTGASTPIPVASEVNISSPSPISAA